MGIMDTIRNRMRSFLQIEPAAGQMINIQEYLDYEANAIKNRIWYRGDGNELAQLYESIGEGNARNMFWASRPTPGMEMRKIHTGLPAVIVDTLAGIVVNNINDMQFLSSVHAEIWEQIDRENKFKKLLDRTVKETLYIGDGAWKISIDRGISEYPILEYFPGDRVEYTMKRGRVTEVIFKTRIPAKNRREYELREFYGMGYVRYELWQGENQVDLSAVESLAGLKPVEFGSAEKPYMMAVPVQFFPSGKWEGRGQSIFDRKIDNFDSLDEAWSQWMDALRAGRAKTYIPENLIPRDPNTGALVRPNAFDNRFIRTEQDMAQGAESKVQTEQPNIPHDSYASTYATALDQCLQGIISPSTLGIDIKKLDNAEAQREKEKVTLYMRANMVEPLQKDLKKLIETALRVYYEMRSSSLGEEVEVDVSFGDYANPSFESQVETIGKAKTQGIMSIEASVDELYGDSRDDEWKAGEVKRLKEEAGIAELEEPALNLEGVNIIDEGESSEENLPDGEEGV